MARTARRNSEPSKEDERPEGTDWVEVFEGAALNAAAMGNAKAAREFLELAAEQKRGGEDKE